MESIDSKSMEHYIQQNKYPKINFQLKSKKKNERNQIIKQNQASSSAISAS